MGKLGRCMFFDSLKDKDKTSSPVTTSVSYPTGFLPLDYMNGKRIEVFDDDDEVIFEYDSCGFVEGTMNLIVADSGLGKTTLCEQICLNIISSRPEFDESFVVHEDIEQAADIDRVYKISGLKAKYIENHYQIRQDGHLEKIVERIMEQVKYKLNNHKDFEYDTGLKDIYGNSMKRLIPTCVIIDSISTMRSENVSIDGNDTNAKTSKEFEDATSNMAGARNAKLNSEMFKQLLPWLKKANIILFIICHINRKIQTGFAPAPRDLVGMGENESLGGGRAIAYVANNVVRLKNKGQLHSDKDWGIDGLLIGVTFYKSRTNASNNEVELIFNKRKGFCKCLSLLNFAINANIVKKQGNKYVIPGCEDSPFSKKSFIDDAVENPNLISALYDVTLPELQKLLGATNSDDDDDESSKFSNDDFISIMFDD